VNYPFKQGCVVIEVANTNRGRAMLKTNKDTLNQGKKERTDR